MSKGLKRGLDPDADVTGRALNSVKFSDLLSTGKAVVRRPRVKTYN